MVGVRRQEGDEQDQHQVHMFVIRLSQVLFLSESSRETWVLEWYGFPVFVEGPAVLSPDDVTGHAETHAPRFHRLV